MSTFKGIMSEFPDIRVDFFRRDPKYSPPLACFLSHIHSDHLAGLDSFKAPFVYCSPATRNILLRLEKYPHRLNVANGVLEHRERTYRHLEKLLKPIPLDTPTEIELEPGRSIQVTLLDANHCPGSTMFLFEDKNHAVLYTGDIRSEPWFVNSLKHKPSLIQYTTGLKTLDCIYLDTTFTQNISFPSQAEGRVELVKKVLQYPPDTVFHFTAWTYGYEQVWLALSHALASKIHVDKYKFGIYRSLGQGSSGSKSPSPSFISPEGPALAGYQCGNTPQPGCLTTDETMAGVRIHSCEKGMYCAAVKDNKNIVWIKPIITRHKGEEYGEPGAGGYGLNLGPKHPSLLLLEQLLSFLKDRLVNIEEDTQHTISEHLQSTEVALSLDDLENLGLRHDEGKISLARVIGLLSQLVGKAHSVSSSANLNNDENTPKAITFPYSRHSSFPELCDLVAAFKPKDVYPCTVDEDGWHEGVSIGKQFGSYCSGKNFRHDLAMRKLRTQIIVQAASQQTHTTERSDDPEVAVEKLPLFQIGSQAPPAKLEARDVGAARTAGLPPSSPVNTPPRVIIAESPGSESQGVRRKVIFDELSSRIGNKRVRLLDGTYSSPLDLGGLSETPPSLPKPQDGDENGIKIDDRIEGYLEYLEFDTIYDDNDKVNRCALCGFELWSEVLGSCTNCDEGHFEHPYFEALDPDTKKVEIAANEYADSVMEDAEKRDLIGDYLDHQSSAYDSQDEDDDFEETYEVNSFIDDGPQESDEDGDDADEEGTGSDGIEEVDWKKRFVEEQTQRIQLQSRNSQLQTEKIGLATELDHLNEEHRELLLEMGIISDENDDEMDDDGILLVNAVAPDPVVTELVLSQDHGQSQASVAGSRNDDSIVAVSAADITSINVEWQRVSLASASDGHAEDEF